jgi:hypothetical protein
MEKESASVDPPPTSATVSTDATTEPVTAESTSEKPQVKPKISVKAGTKRNVTAIQRDGSSMYACTAPIFVRPSLAGFEVLLDCTVSLYKPMLPRSYTGDFKDDLAFALVHNLNIFLRKDVLQHLPLGYDTVESPVSVPQVIARAIASLGGHFEKNDATPAILPDRVYIVDTLREMFNIPTEDFMNLASFLGRWTTIIRHCTQYAPNSWMPTVSNQASLLRTGVRRVGEEPERFYYVVAECRLSRSDELLAGILKLRAFEKQRSFYFPHVLDSEVSAIPKLVSYWSSSRAIDVGQFVNEYLHSEFRKG